MARSPWPRCWPAPVPAAPFGSPWPRWTPAPAVRPPAAWMKRSASCASRSWPPGCPPARPSWNRRAPPNVG
ncbi:hypothetical protein D3867_08845 [Azospirillum argentinense]|uniref:Uncharacterized protein n=1 Tax=Azospirillum brasilense TaxID=192 RepID=A0A4D8Q3Y7_AZOBR|nr:hypothetical protein D3867_08845 [Azospirillum argentinense]